ncbi:PREDICTED: cAMP-regulated D2 protein-like [Branchiostoma belcheri]|uniref:Carboxylic ester hydrolase n=1 Tax=Branchiostoma belcheri TaxID=7741 RepID=A0A6P4YMB9_BRABE|nr:PREDICTED: cAMP-regulated D2 protein-like [Branchiostoma belcheri]
MASRRVVQTLVLGILLLDVCFGYPVQEDGPTVQTQFGAVQGMSVEEGGIFLGLPFAVPPVGQLRWKPPQPYTASWAPSVRDGTQPGPACRQPGCGPTSSDVQHTCNRDANRTQSEDCLYLNVFVPDGVLNSTAKPLPVLLWIHGGNYRVGTGSAMVYDGRFLADKTQTVVVTINYRLGAFGFLVTGEGEDDAKGNAGLLDQVEALKWVQKNIGSFGGDKDKVTIFGQSAGSDSVATHLTSNRTADLFARAIMMSVPFSIPHKTRKEALRLGKYFAEQLNCSLTDMTCLRSKKPDDVVDAQEKAFTHIINPLKPIESFMQWGPSVDFDVVPAPTVDSFVEGRFQKKPFIIGTTWEENIFYVYQAYTQNITSKLKLDEIVATFVQEKAIPILATYKPQTSPDYRVILSEIATDWIFTCPTRKVARSAAGKYVTDVWLYLFDHAWSFKHLWDEFKFCNGHVCHGGDIPFVFQTPPLANLTFTPDEQRMADTIVFHYGNFAHTGDPNTPPDLDNNNNINSTNNNRPKVLNWPKYGANGHFYRLNVTTPENNLLENFKREKCDEMDKLNVYH